MSFFDQLDGGTTAGRCLALIERHAPALIRIGGSVGGLSEEKPRSGKRLSDAERERIVATAGLGGNLKQICVATGWSWGTVNRVLRAAGVTCPDGRAGRKSARLSYRVPVFAAGGATA